MEWLSKQTGMMGLDLCATHSFTNNLALLFDILNLPVPIPLTIATKSSNAKVTKIGKLKLKNDGGSIVINNVFYSPKVTCTLLSAESLRLGGGRLAVEEDGAVGLHFDNGFSLRSLPVGRRWQIPFKLCWGYPPTVLVPAMTKPDRKSVV